MNKLALYQNAFKEAGLRMTEQRQIICAWLAETDMHPTPYEIYEAIARDHPEISRATIYNTLNTLQQLGAIVEINFGANHTHYDTDPSPHINLICLRCHRVVDYHADLHAAALQPGVPAALRTRIADETGFHALSARTDVLGICEVCRRAEDAQPGAQLHALQNDEQHYHYKHQQHSNNHSDQRGNRAA